jgi:hypothetical protein
MALVFQIMTRMESLPIMKAAAALCSMLAINAQAFANDLSNAAQYAAGIYSSIFVHEVGHAIVAKVSGAENIEIEIPRKGTLLSGVTRWKPPANGLSAAQTQWLSLSGLLAANLVGEAIVANSHVHRSPYAQAVLGSALASNAIHIFTYYTRIRGADGYQGNDIDQFELAGGNPHLLSAGLAAYSLWTLHRMRQREIPLFGVNLRF